jgi:hypothetical protein
LSEENDRINDIDLTGGQEIALRAWEKLVASGSADTFAVSPIFKFFRVSAVGALGAGPLGSTVMIGIK